MAKANSDSSDGTNPADSPANKSGATVMASSSPVAPPPRVGAAGKGTVVAPPKLPGKPAGAPPRPVGAPPKPASSTVVASAPPPKPAGATMVASGAPPKPVAPPQPVAAAPSGTVVASGPPPEAAAAGGTMVASDGAVPAPIAVQHSAPVVQDLIGTTLLGRYKVIKKLGEGGMGTVYLGEHATIGKKFAVKVLSHEFAHKDDLRERFLQEARAASMISQENVVEITDFGDTPDGSVFFVMEFLAGEDLSDTVKSQGKLPWARVKPIMLQICRALAAAHDAGIIHRDMKPENCYRVRRGKNEDFIKVLDFGIAKVTSDEDGEGKGLTRTGMIFGTPEYMSPEQAQGARPDHRVDVYATGVIMYELLTGRVPFQADTFMGILTKHMFEVPEAPSAVVPDANIPPEVEAIILKAMQKDRELRFAGMVEMAEAIEAVGSGAAAVDVVAENIARPSTGEMAFTGGRPTPMPGTVPPVSAEYPPPEKSKRGIVLAVVGGLALAAAGIGAFIAFSNDKPDATAEAATEPADELAVVAGPPDSPEAVEEPEKLKEIAAGTETVNYHIKTKGPEGELIEAKILDPLDNAIYGMTNTDEGVEVERSEQALKLILKAQGFEPKEIEIYPVRDKHFEYTLAPVKVEAPKSKKPTKKPNKPKSQPKKIEPKPKPKDPEPKDPEPKKVEPKPKDPETKPPRRVSPDLKDPFGRKR